MKLLHETVIETAMRCPDADAISCNGQITSYYDLDRTASYIAAVMHSLGVKHGKCIVLFAEKSSEVIATMQAVLRIRGVYVPVDIHGSTERLNKIIKDCAAQFVFTTKDRFEALIDLGIDISQIIVLGSPEHQRSWERLSKGLNPFVYAVPACLDDMAYILYTSGSTGTPKGVCITHRNAMAFIEWAVDTFEICSNDRLANHASFHFDLSVFDLYAAFSTGACVEIIPESYAYMPGELVSFISLHKITVWYSVPAALVMMVRDGELYKNCLDKLRIVLFAGESFPIKYLRLLRNILPHIRMFNLFGPTETNVCTYFEVRHIAAQETHPVPIGIAASGDHVWSRNAQGNECGIEEEGELIVSGPTVMQGYFGHPKLAASVYATGDIVKKTQTGDYIYVGRTDDMLKLRGYRIERGEVESCLLSHPALRDAAVVVTGSGDTKILHAFVVVEPDHLIPGLLAIKAHLAKQLPRYMIIDQLTIVNALPLNGNGKVNYRELTKE